MREIRQSGSEGGVARKRHPYPYFSVVPLGLIGNLIRSRLARPHLCPLPQERRWVGGLRVEYAV
jgi:hypothetical protein